MTQEEAYRQQQENYEKERQRQLAGATDRNSAAYRHAKLNGGNPDAAIREGEQRQQMNDQLIEAQRLDNQRRRAEADAVNAQLEAMKPGNISSFASDVRGGFSVGGNARPTMTPQQLRARQVYDGFNNLHQNNLRQTQQRQADNQAAACAMMVQCRANGGHLPSDTLEAYSQQLGVPVSDAYFDSQGNFNIISKDQNGYDRVFAKMPAMQAYRTLTSNGLGFEDGSQQYLYDTLKSRYTDEQLKAFGVPFPSNTAAGKGNGGMTLEDRKALSDHQMSNRKEYAEFVASLKKDGEGEKSAAAKKKQDDMFDRMLANQILKNPAAVDILVSQILGDDAADEDKASFKEAIKQRVLSRINGSAEVNTELGNGKIDGNDTKTEEFQKGKTYKVGDTVRKDGKIYVLGPDNKFHPKK